MLEFKGSQSGIPLSLSGHETRRETQKSDVMIKVSPSLQLKGEGR